MLNNALSDFTRLLLQSGADPTITSNGQTSKTNAAAEGRGDILAVYQEHAKGLENKRMLEGRGSSSSQGRREKSQRR